MRRLRFFIVLLLLGCVGCGSDADLAVHIETLDSEDPFEGVGLLRVTLERDTAGNVVSVETFPSSETEMSLPTLSNQGIVRILIDGFESDVHDPILACGSSRWVRPEAGVTTEVHVCFCKMETVGAGGCVCTSGD